MIIADTVNNQVYEIIKSMILERKLKPGDRIDPKGIAAEHNISLMPVRSALQQLTTQGLVVTLQRVGFFVKDFSRAELLEIVDTRKMFELHCLETYFHNLQTEESASLLEKLQSTPDSHIKAQRSLDVKMHRMIVHASRNAFLIGQYDNLRCLFSIGGMYYADQNVGIAKNEHIRIMTGICSGKKEAALTELRLHLERTVREIIECTDK